MTRRVAALLALLPCLFPASPSQSQSCREIRFAQGASSGTVTGEAGNDGTCYAFASGAGQTARITLDGPDTMCVTIPDVVDCQSDYSWTTQARSYELLVFQMFRKSAPAPFKLTLSIR